MVSGRGKISGLRSAPAKDRGWVAEEGWTSPGTALTSSRTLLRATRRVRLLFSEKWALWHFYLHVRATLAELEIGTFPALNVSHL